MTADTTDPRTLIGLPVTLKCSGMAYKGVLKEVTDTEFVIRLRENLPSKRILRSAVERVTPVLRDLKKGEKW